MKGKWLKVLIALILVGAVVWAGKGLFKYSFYETHDLKRQITRGFDAVLTIREGHFPLRWAGFTNYGCGVPTFNFYYPLFYYLIVIINFFTGGVMLPIKIISLLSIAIGTLFFYLWMKKETGNMWAALSSALIYLYAPYWFLLIYVRGDPEYLSYAILPVVLYFFSKAFSAKNKFHFFIDLFWSAIFGGFLAISHNVVSVFVMPIIFVYLIAKIIQSKKLELDRIITVFLSFISAFGIGAFFIFPAFLEMRFTQIATPIFNYKDHFPALWQLWNSKWGYGDSAVGTALDGLSFQLGYAHWVVLALVVLWFLYYLLRKKVNFKWAIENLLVLVFFAISLVCIYLMLSVSIPVWEAVGLSKILDFPWRLLGIAVFSISALFGFWVSTIKSRKLFMITVAFVALLAFYGNRNHLLAQPVLDSDLPFYKSLDSFSIGRNSVPAFADNILPPNAKVSCNPATPVLTSNSKNDKIIFNEIERGSTFGVINLNIDIKALKGNKMVFNLSYFPGIFNFFVNGQKVNYTDCGGLICIDTLTLKSGNNQLSWKVGQTGIEQVFNAVSILFIVSWICIIIYAFGKYAKK
jgi:hypothetical protein